MRRTRTFAILEGTPNALFPNGTRLVRLDRRRPSSTRSSPPGRCRRRPVPRVARRSIDFPFTSLTRVQAARVSLSGRLHLGRRPRLTGGYEWERETQSRADGRAGPRQQRASSCSSSSASPTAGSRPSAAASDSKETLDTFFSPKLSAGGFVVPVRGGALSSVKVFGNIGKGIKSPSFSDASAARSPIPSPDLKVEKARTGDIGVEATFADQRFAWRA